LYRPGLPRKAPKDVEYFTAFKKLAVTHGSKKIYADFIAIYELTDRYIDENVLELISDMATEYKSDKNRIELLFTIVYAGMVAEENKSNAILKKKIKRLGMHNILVDNLSPTVAANFSRGKKWQEINRECEQRGF
jgi:hypothetical protein